MTTDNEMQYLAQEADYFQNLQTQTGWGRVLSRFSDWIDPQAGWLTLDVGCGPGLMPALLAQKGCRSFGMDINHRMFLPVPLHPQVATGNVMFPPFPDREFDLITISNLLFLLSDPLIALKTMVQLLRSDGQIATLNPSEHLTLKAATELAESRNLDGLARESLLNWAALAESNIRWSVVETRHLYSQAGLELIEAYTTIGPGFARFGSGKRV